MIYDRWTVCVWYDLKPDESAEVRREVFDDQRGAEARG